MNASSSASRVFLYEAPEPEREGLAGWALGPAAREKFVTQLRSACSGDYKAQGSVAELRSQAMVR